MKVTIYCAHCIVTGKKYIGQTKKEFEHRVKQHKNSYQKNKYKNSKFYNAIKKYGWTNFIWGIIESENDTIWNESEIYYVEKYNTFYGGYNTTKGGNNRIGYTGISKKFRLLSPDGYIVEGENVSKFCKENNLPCSGINKVLDGKGKSCKGWKKPETEFVGGESRALTTSREYVIMDSEGNIHRGRNVSKLCRDYNLANSAITRLLNGEIYSYKGWKLPNTTLTGGKLTSKKLQREYKLISPEGKIFIGKGVRELCKNFNLNESAISEVLNGKREHYKGWKKYNGTISSLCPLFVTEESFCK